MHEQKVSKQICCDMDKHGLNCICRGILFFPTVVNIPKKRDNCFTLPGTLHEIFYFVNIPVMCLDDSKSLQYHSLMTLLLHFLVYA